MIELFSGGTPFALQVTLIHAGPLLCWSALEKNSKSRFRIRPARSHYAPFQAFQRRARCERRCVPPGRPAAARSSRTQCLGPSLARTPPSSNSKIVSIACTSRNPSSEMEVDRWGGMAARDHVFAAPLACPGLAAPRRQGKRRSFCRCVCLCVRLTVCLPATAPESPTLRRCVPHGGVAERRWGPTC